MMADGQSRERLNLASERKLSQRDNHYHGLSIEIGLACSSAVNGIGIPGDLFVRGTSKAVSVLIYL